MEEGIREGGEVFNGEERFFIVLVTILDDDGSEPFFTFDIDLELLAALFLVVGLRTSLMIFSFLFLTTW